MKIQNWDLGEWFLEENFCIFKFQIDARQLESILLGKKSKGYLPISRKYIGM